ncbi:MAG: hypothetical protein BWY82_02884 [Verrucomicrobia bacterium ADurb.Bin474]|nr:MAG: hypothetical protein BWY82_02884 [Verrucomicrobia bacterium ADurb.Bin474]
MDPTTAPPSEPFIGDRSIVPSLICKLQIDPQKLVRPRPGVSALPIPQVCPRLGGDISRISRVDWSRQILNQHEPLGFAHVTRYVKPGLHPSLD